VISSRPIDPPVALFVDGVLTTSGSEKTVNIINPSNGERLLAIPAGCEADVSRAVASSRSAFDDGRWSDAAPSFRKQALLQWAALIEARAAELDLLDAQEMGKPVSLGFCNAVGASGLLRFNAEAIDKIAGDVLSSDRHSFVAQRRVPRGVVAAVTPWNFPTFVALLKLAPALAAGNCVVFKPSEMSTRSALRLAQLATDAGLPPGVLNVVPGLGENVGRALGLHREVDMITFTGSTDVGKKMMTYAGQSNLKVVMAECGGKSPQVVFADGVDLDAVCASIAQTLLINQGQLCSTGSRVLVQRSIENALVHKIAAHLQRITMGDATDPRTTYGPLVSAKQYQRVMRYIDTAEGEGAQRVIGGRPALQESGGYFVEPAIFRDVRPEAKIAREEIFGPVLSVIPFEQEADAVAIANSTVYGLWAYVWTTDLARGMRMAKSIRSSVMINAASPIGEGPGHAATTEPTGQSGFGAEGGMAGMESYLRRQLVWFGHG
jgi:acyl-CoA reductase-like NAD-dependent aldehyde dehydrogenase